MHRPARLYGVRFLSRNRRDLTERFPEATWRITTHLPFPDAWTIGAVTQVPLGRDIQAIRGSEKSKKFLESLFADAWLEFNLQDEHLTLREREVSELGDYNIYVERCWQIGVPGTDECVSLCVADNLTMKIAAMRSAILLANGNLKETSWDVSEHLIKL